MLIVYQHLGSEVRLVVRSELRTVLQHAIMYESVIIVGRFVHLIINVDLSV